MSFPKLNLRWIVHLVILVALLSPLTNPGVHPPPEIAAAAPLQESEPFDAWTDLFRVWVTFPNAASRARLNALEVVVLEETDTRALILADAEQLETLARLRFRPEAADDLGMLVEHHADTMPELARSIQPLLTQARAMHALRLETGFDAGRALSTRDTLALQRAQTDLRATLQSLTVAQQAGIMAMTSLDSDGDGLTDTEEYWWCTDPMNPNSDGDAQGYTDGQEVAALLDFTLPRAVRWGYGPPFGPPNAWPDFNGQDGNPATPACNDGDYDTIPDYAEIYMVGSRVPEESTDRDKFDDGQELFGVTYCPGAPASCGYGSYPRIEYWNYIKATMPTWVLPPGDNLFVTAFPVPEVSAIPGSWTVERVTTITTQQGQMTQQSHSYETSVMRGESTNIADTVTWNNWEEVSQAVETPFNLSRLQPNVVIPWPLIWQGAKWVGIKALEGVVAGAAWDTIKDFFSGEDEKNNVEPPSTYASRNISVSSSAEAYASIVLNQSFDFQGVLNSLDGVQYAINQQGELLARGLYDISYAISQPRFIETRTQGRSWGGAQTTMHEIYEEHTISEGEAFTTGENWSTAWAVDSSHAANLTFNYTVQNSGTEYARELTGLVFNIYLGDDKTPIISYPAWQQFPNGKLENVFPGAVNTFASTSIPLTLEQMKRIDLGDRLIVVLEDYSYGADELFYQDAVNGGVTVFIEDGVDDGDETVDSYVIPTWGAESVQDVLTRFFPASYDLDSNLNALWTPEFNGINPPAWNEHYLSDIAWWNVYLTQADAGNIPLKDLTAQAGSALLFRFNRDSDRDGYQDRVEMQYGTDKNDPASHPQPEVLAGYVASRSGNVVTVKLVLGNSGTFDAYGIDAVMYSPDDTTTIGNNTVGGNGRVRPGAHVAVGSLIKSPALNGWSSSTARPYAGGQFTGNVDRVFTFSAATPGVVGQSSTAVTWNDGAGSSGTLALGSSYHAPLPLDVVQGLQVGFNTGTIMAGATFTVAALTPRDTFTYTINTEPYTPPVIVVSYSDPQGSHRFVTPAELPTMDSSLAPYAGQMLKGIALEVATTDAVNSSATNITNLIVNNPHPATIQNGHLYVNFVSDGQLVAELPFTLTIPAGPTVFPVSWTTSVFSETYNPEADNILIAFWTDSEGNIIDSAARPLNTFATDPRATLAMDNANVIWDFGEAAQGTVLKRSFDLANTGYLDLLTYVNAPTNVSLSQQGSRSVSPADVTTYEIALDTSTLPVGPYSETITIRSSDPAIPTQTVYITGSITVGTSDTPAGALQRPLDWPVTLSSGTQGQWIQFTHTLGPDPQTLHPVKVYNQGYDTLWGAGKYATVFGLGATAQKMFGDGSDGDLTVAAGQTVYVDNTRAALAATATAGQNQVNVANAAGFAVGQEILLIQMRGSGAGSYEFQRIITISGNTLTLAANLGHTYTAGGNSKAQLIRVMQYGNLTVQTGGILTAHAWDGNTGGVLTVKVSEVAQIAGSILATGLGYRGGTAGMYGAPVSAQGWQGESHVQEGAQSRNANYGAGGGGQGDDGTRNVGAGGGGAGYGSAGISGQAAGNPVSYPGVGGSVYGSADLATAIFLGAAGGGGGADDNNDGPGGYGGNGGGLVLLSALNLNVSGDIRADGNNGLSGSAAHRTGGGGGGAGGSILLRGYALNLGTDRIRAIGGNGGPGTDKYGTTPAGGDGGNGSNGRIRVEYCQTLSGSTNPAASTQQFSCHIAEQVETSPYTDGRLNLPETFVSERTYQVQYGWRHVFSSAGEQTFVVRVPAAGYNDVRLESLISEIGTGTRTFRLDIGNDGAWDWEWTGSVSNAITLNSPDLSAAFSHYWANHGAPTSGTVDVPVRIYLSQAGQVLLTTLRVTPTGSKVRYAQLSAQTYSTVTLNLSVGTSGSGPLTVAADVGDDGVVDWIYTAANLTLPLALSTGNLATEFNAYLAGNTGEVAVPIRFYVTPFVTLDLENFSATVSTQPDITLAPIDIAFGAAAPTEGDNVPITVTLHNNGALTATGHTVAFYATTPEWGEWYIGSAFIPEIHAGGAIQATILWDTLGFTGTTPVRAVADPYNRLTETNEDNNQAIANLTILTRPNLHTSFAAFSNPEPVVRETITVSLQVDNLGQTGSGLFAAALYDGNPNVDGELLQTVDLTVPGEDTAIVEFTWTPTAPGPHRLFALADRERVINDPDRSNNLSWQDIYVGFAGPLLMNSGGATDPAYSPELGYGVLDEGPSDVIGSCGIAPHESYRLDPAGQVVYRFDHLLPGHFYHLDVTLYECDGASRQQSIRVNGHLVAGPIDLGDGQVHRLSLLLDPALYSGHTIVVEIEADGVDGALVNEVNLHDIDYRYANAGSTNDPQYPGGALAILGRPYGWLDGVANAAWGVLPYQSVRVNQTGNLLRYRFDGLQPEKRYNVHLTFWQPSGAARIQRVQLDGLDTGLTVNTGDYQVHRETVAVPPTAYADDGSVVVGVLRINAASGAIINEIALEEETIPRASWCAAQQTPYFTDVYGDVAILGQNAPAGTVIEARNPRGETVGCFVVSAAGQYGFMRIYGEDITATPPIPGMRAGELVIFRVNGAPAVATPLLYWQADYGTHKVDLNAGSIEGQLVLMNPGWNLISFRLDPPVPTVRQVLDSVDGRYDRVLGETDAYAPSIPDVYNTLKELHPGLGYYVRVTGTTAATALIEGLTVPVTTPISLHPGWNWIGYLPEVTLPITQALQSIERQYQRVLSLDKTFDPALPGYSTLRFMEPGKGYLIYANQVITLVYPTESSILNVEAQNEIDMTCVGLSPTPQFTLVYGDLLINEQPAPIRSRVEVLTPRGDVAGCVTLETPGIIGLMHVYGEDDTSSPLIGGFREGESLTFRVNGIPVETVSLTWRGDCSPHPILLEVDHIHVYLPLVIRER